MELTLTTPAVLFPAVSLLLLAYTNRFLAIAGIVRNLVNRPDVAHDENTLQQIGNLRKRIQLIKWMQASGIGSLFFCVVSILLLYFGLAFAGKATFAFSLFLMLLSLAVSFTEIVMSGIALNVELKRVLDRK
ncbi:MAG: DUF2721 domain-containing protein [Opitutales bacterium]|nr:DUF2721 domain-containing protein [Opitutales bacterium]